MRHVFVLLSLFLFSANLMAADRTLVRSDVESLLNQNRSVEAYEMISKNHDPASTDPQEWFLLGMAAKKTGHTWEAKKAFEKVLALDPASPRVKLELAALFFKDGGYDKAQELLLDVKSENPPDGVVQNIDRFLAVIERTKKENKSYRFQLSAGLLYDSNVNAGPQSDTVTLFGLPFILDDVAMPHDDIAYVLEAGFDHVIKVSHAVKWQSSFSLSWKDYFEQDDFDALALSVSSGPVVEVNDRLIFYTPVIGDISWYSDIDEYLYTTIGISPQVRYDISKKVKLNIISGLNNRNFKTFDDRDAWIYTFTPGLDYAISRKLSLRSGLTLGWEDADQNVYSNRNWALNGTLFYTIRKDLLATFSGSYGRSFYEEEQAMFDKRRKDEKYNIGFDMRYRWQAIDADLVLACSYVSNGSNIDLYEYDRANISLRLKKSF